ncbi:hypothetical protein [Campylobacter sp. MG1]|uniref:hypothetical protein n=1 Tax=Campylobacter sp. MG1 TaxID=2976332 RepID=UPI00226CEF96|nr:hypothetical protein [Campylobacter sp. MG1]
MIKEQIKDLDYKEFGYNTKAKFDKKVQIYLECNSDEEFLDRATWDGCTSNRSFLVLAYELLGMNIDDKLNEYDKLKDEIQRLSVCYCHAITDYKVTSWSNALGYGLETKVKLNKDDFMFLDTNATEQKLKALAKEHYKEKNGIIRGCEIIEYYAKVGTNAYYIKVDYD